MARTTPNRRAFQEEIKKIERLVARLSKQGYNVEPFTIPTPERVTKKRLQIVKSIIPSIKAHVKEIEQTNKKSITLIDEKHTRLAGVKESPLSTRVATTGYIPHPRERHPERYKWTQAMYRLKKAGYLVPDYSPSWGAYDIEKLYAMSYYRDPETGKLTPAVEERHRRRVEAGKRAYETREQRRKENQTMWDSFLEENPDIEFFEGEPTPEPVKQYPSIYDAIVDKLLEFLNELIDTAKTSADGAEYLLAQFENALKSVPPKVVATAYKMMVETGREITFVEAYYLMAAQAYWDNCVKLIDELTDGAFNELTEMVEDFSDQIDDYSEPE